MDFRNVLLYSEAIDQFDGEVVVLVDCKIKEKSVGERSIQILGTY